MTLDQIQWKLEVLNKQTDYYITSLSNTKAEIMVLQELVAGMNSSTELPRKKKKKPSPPKKEETTDSPSTEKTKKKKKSHSKTESDDKDFSNKEDD